MRTIGLGNALVDVVLRVKDESVLSDIGIAKGAMELIDKDQMIRLRSASTDLPGRFLRAVQYVIPSVQWQI